MKVLTTLITYEQYCMTCTVDTMFYLGETLTGENPSNLSNEDC